MQELADLWAGKRYRSDDSEIDSVITRSLSLAELYNNNGRTDYEVGRDSFMGEMCEYGVLRIAGNYAVDNEESVSGDYHYDMTIMGKKIDVKHHKHGDSVLSWSSDAKLKSLRKNLHLIDYVLSATVMADTTDVVPRFLVRADCFEKSIGYSAKGCPQLETFKRLIQGKEFWVLNELPNHAKIVIHKGNIPCYNK